MTHLANELRLVDAARAGNSDAFASLVSPYNQNVYRLAVNITHNHEDAEDVRQEALIKAYSNLGRFRGGSRFYTWLVRIALNEALMKLRKRRPGRQVSLDQLIESDDKSVTRQESPDWRYNPEQRYARSELKRALSQAIQGLDARSRAVLVLRDLKSFSTRETGEMLGLSVTTVKTRLRRARMSLRESLKGRVRDHLKGQIKNQFKEKLA
jgi:RNA polymerase sigma-70 factor, ECF subfamily